MTKTDFNKVAYIVKLDLHNLNRGRNAAYSFDNNAYISKTPKYMSGTAEAAEGEAYPRKFIPVREGRNVDVPPPDNPDQKPSSWVLQVMGFTPGSKKLEATSVAFTERIKDKYKEIKKFVFKVSNWLRSTSKSFPLAGEEGCFGRSFSFHCQL